VTSALLGSKAITLREAAMVAKASRESGHTVILTNGCFDVLHHGHISLLREARAMGDVLFVAVNSDESVRQLKGESRPFIPLPARLASLAELACVDYLVVFHESGPQAIIREVRPDFLVKGADYREEEIVGSEIVRAYGGSVRLAAYVSGISTSGLIHRRREERSSIPPVRPDSPGNSSCRIGIIGDLCLDRVIAGPVTTQSREYPIPVISHRNDLTAPGGAGNLAVNVARCGANAIACGVVGADASGRQLFAELGGENVDTSLMVLSATRLTPSYTKIVGWPPGGHHAEVARIDSMNESSPTNADVRALGYAIDTLLSRVDLVVASCYEDPNASVLGPETRRYLIDQCRSKNITMIAACRHNILSFREADLLVVNEVELAALTDRTVEGVLNEASYDSLSEAGRQSAAGGIIATFGELGAVMWSHGGVVASYPARVLPPGINTTGAGDVFLAALSVAVARGLDVSNAIRCAVRTATRALTSRRRPVVAAPSSAELLDRIVEKACSSVLRVQGDSPQRKGVNG
jgi:rfaE bifunctional protein nucleotidyltransferase chain/domain/rfaE bifunctional protein kinase chain/domain